MDGDDRLTLNELLATLWDDYLRLNPQARAINTLLEGRGEKIVNDHIALRTYRHPAIGLNALVKIFEGHDYQVKGVYDFPEKKLTARHLEHSDSRLPRIFISELLPEEFSSDFQKIITGLLKQIPPHTAERHDLAIAGRLWQLTFADYKSLLRESEYGAWVAALGLRANHFTISVNALKKLPTLEALNELLRHEGFPLNTAGGEIKGSPEQLLEQSSTMANQIEVKFSDGRHLIPACYYEFARRYNDSSGRLYQGFIAASANRIFESTGSQE